MGRVELDDTAGQDELDASRVVPAEKRDPVARAHAISAGSAQWAVLVITGRKAGIRGNRNGCRELSESDSLGRMS